MIALEALGALIRPHPISKPLHVLIVGVIGLLINIFSLGILHGGHSLELHIDHC